MRYTGAIWLSTPWFRGWGRPGSKKYYAQSLDAYSSWLVVFHYHSLKGGGLMVSVFVSGSSSLGHCTRNLTLTVALSIQVYEWVTANLMLGGNPTWTSIPSIYIASWCNRNWNKFWFYQCTTHYLHVYLPFLFFLYHLEYIGFCSR